MSMIIYIVVFAFLEICAFLSLFSADEFYIEVLYIKCLFSLSSSVL